METLQQNDLSVFEELIPLLELMGLESQFEPIDPDNPVEHLIVMLEPDEQGNTLPVRLAWLEDIVEAGMDSLGGGVGMPDSYTLEFQAPIAIPIPQEKVLEVAQLAQVFSRSLFFGAIGLMPRHGLVYRYALPQLERKLDLELTAQILTVITQTLHLFNTRLTELLSGRPLAELLANPKG